MTNENIYELVLPEDTKFNASDFPKEFQILRKDKPPLIFRPSPTVVQDVNNRLDEAEQLLKEIQKNTGWTIHDDSVPNPQVRRSIEEYFKRHGK